VFAGAGYRTYAIAANANICPKVGFDRYVCLRKATVEQLSESLEAWALEMPASPEPTLLYLHRNDVHGPNEDHLRRGSLRQVLALRPSRDGMTGSGGCPVGGLSVHSTGHPESRRLGPARP